MRPLEPSDCTPGRKIICVDASHTGVLSVGSAYHVRAYIPPEAIVPRKFSDKFEPGVILLQELDEWAEAESYGIFVIMIPAGFQLWRFRIPEEKEEEVRVEKAEKERV